MTTMVKFDADWADEFNCEEFIILDLELSKVREMLEKWLSTEDEYFFGTNESFESEDISIEDFSLIDLNLEEKNTVLKFLGNRFGTGILSEFKSFVYRELGSSSA